MLGEVDIYHPFVENLHMSSIIKVSIKKEYKNMGKLFFNAHALVALYVLDSLKRISLKWFIQESDNTLCFTVSFTKKNYLKSHELIGSDGCGLLLLWCHVSERLPCLWTSKHIIRLRDVTARGRGSHCD